MDKIENKKQELTQLRTELADTESRRQQLLQRISEIESDLSRSGSSYKNFTGIITNFSSIQDKIKLYRSLFRGREDEYPRRFESTKTGKSGFQPACKNEWVREVCSKPKGFL
jgi:hypothetical protein